MNYKLPEPDTHCFDEDTKTDCWSYSSGLMQAAYAQGRKDALEDAAKVLTDETEDGIPLEIFAQRIKELK